MKSAQDIEGMFDTHQPSEDGSARHNSVRGVFKSTAQALDQILPEGDSNQARCKALAMTKLEEAAFWANKSVAYLTDAVPSETPAPAAESAPNDA